MIKFELSIASKNDCEIENLFWEFINENEICTVQADCEYSEKFNAWEMQIVPQFDEEKKEFMQLCNEMIEYFEELGYNF